MTHVNVNEIMAYEQGELSDSETLRLFSTLVKTGLVWSLQGMYGRVARDMIDSGYLTPGGDITEKADDL